MVLAAGWLGTTLLLLPWGMAADRLGERPVIGVGMTGCGLALLGAAWAPSAAWLAVFLVLAGALGAGVQSGSGRAVMRWFDERERGLAFGVRQTAVPIGGLIGALALPLLEETRGLGTAFVFLAVLCSIGAAVAVVTFRDRPADAVAAEDVGRSFRDRRLWILCGASGLYVAAQVVLITFLVLYLHDERGFSPREAAAVLAVVQVIAVALRIAAGRWSDKLASRIVPLRRIGLAVFAALGLSALLIGAPNTVLVPTLVAAAALSMAWNGLSFVAAAELAGSSRSGAAIGFQQTVLSVMGIGVGPAFAALVESSSWRTGFALAALAPLAGWGLLSRLR